MYTKKDETIYSTYSTDCNKDELPCERTEMEITKYNHATPFTRDLLASNVIKNKNKRVKHNPGKQDNEYLLL